MNCRPGDLCFIVGTHPSLNINDRIVKLADKPATWCSQFMVWEWQLEEPMDIKPLHRVRSIQSGEVLGAGEVGEVWSVPDCMLRPIRGDGLTDKAVRELYAPSRDEVTS